MTKFNLYIVRHGETYYNIYHKLQGWSNSPLTEKGIKDAENIADKLKNTPFVAAYTSDTTRAEETLKRIVNKNTTQQNYSLNTEVSPLLRGAFYGYYEGDNIDQSWYLAGAPHGLPTFQKIADKYSIGKTKDYLKEADPFNDAENNKEYWKRWDQGIQLIRKNPNIKEGSNVLLVNHTNSIMSFVERFGNGKFDATKRPANGSLTKAVVSDDDIEVTDYNLQ